MGRSDRAKQEIVTVASTLRILHLVATGKRRGAEIFAADLVRALATAGVSQRVAMLRHSGPLAVRFDAPVSILPSGGLKVPGLGVHLETVRGLRTLIEAWRPNVVQAHGGEALKNVASSLVGTRLPLIYRKIGLAPPWLVHGLRRGTYGWLIRRAACVVAVAEDIQRQTVSLFRVPASIVVTIPNGVDRERIAPTRGREEIRRSLGIPGDTPVLASVGAITWEKDPFVHLRVAARVLRRLEVVHVWVGDGPMREALQATGRQLGLDGRLLLVGSRTDVGDLLAASDILLFASRGDGMEGMPATVIEAGMAGLPVAGFAVAGVPEVVVDGETGLLASPGDEDGLVDRVMELVEDEDRRRVMGKAGRERCLARFEIGTISRRYLSLYEEVAGS